MIDNAARGKLQVLSGREAAFFGYTYPAMANTDPPSNSSFLGGGPRFNQAGENTPMPGEKVAAEAPKLPFGGPRVWAGVIIVVVLIAVLYGIYGSSWGIGHKGGYGNRGGVDSRPDANPDAPASGN